MMETRITVVDGCDGLTPDMLRCVPQQREIDRQAHLIELELRPNSVPFWYQQDRMHD